MSYNPKMVTLVFLKTSHCNGCTTDVLIWSDHVNDIKDGIEVIFDFTTESHSRFNGGRNAKVLWYIISSLQTVRVY